MSVEIKVPALGESITEATIANWLKKQGEAVEMDEPVVELETDKVTVEVNATAAGVISEITAQDGDTVEVGTVLGHIDTSGKAAKGKASSQSASDDSKSSTKAASSSSSSQKSEEKSEEKSKAQKEGASSDIVMPAAQKLLADHNLDASSVKGTGKDGRITKEDVQNYLDQDGKTEDAGEGTISIPKFERPARSQSEKPELEERVRMSKLRRTIAGRLKEAQNTAAILTTFNEVDMSGIMELRKSYKDDFADKHGIKLGFMSFFVKAAIQALREFPAVNAEISGDEIIYKNYYDIGVAVGTPNGLVVPVVRDADHLSFAEVEKTIAALGKKARDGKLTMQDMTGGTFTISNGGVYGSLMSTPILNPPQSGILGMHKTQERPMVVNGEIKIRPMMYLALSYDHRIVDGREAVSFLVRIKDAIEDPARLLLGV